MFAIFSWLGLKRLQPVDPRIPGVVYGWFPDGEHSYPETTNGNNPVTEKDQDWIRANH